MNRQAGQALNEYVLIGLAIAVLSLPALMLLRGQLGDLMGNMIHYTRAPKAVAVTTPLAGTLVGQTLGGGDDQGVTVKLGSGKTIKLPGYPRDVSNFVRTTGANGATSLLSNTLTDTAKQMLLSEEINPAQYNSLVALANQGHKIASIEKAVQDAVSALPPGQRMTWETPATWEGQKTTVYDLYLKIGYFYVTKGDLQTSGYLNDTQHAGSDIQQLLALYQNAVGSGALKDPTVQTLVSGLSTDIAAMSYDFIGAMNQLTDGSLVPANMNDSLAAQATHSNSAGICEAGSAEDNGVQCAN